MPAFANARLVIVALALGIVAALSATGLFDPVNDWLTASRARILPALAASDAVIVAIDTDSLQRDRAWPWSRSKYAALVDRLDQAGAKSIAFDFDFSSEGDGDAAFAAAIAKAEAPVLVAVFRREFEGVPGVFAEMLPNPALAPEVFLASTAYVADEDGLIRTYSDSIAYSFGNVPSMAYALAGRAPSGEEVGLSLARRPGQIPVYSFGDVIDGRADMRAFADKTVIVGATAIELGDEFAMPAYGLQSGVMLNALAYEAAVVGDFPKAAPWPLIVFVSFFPIAAAMIAAPSERHQMPRYGLQNLGAAGVVAAIALGAQHIAHVIVPTMDLYAVQALCLLGVGVLSIDRFAAKDYRSRMALKTSASFMEALIASNHDGVLIVDRHGHIARINDKVATFAADPQAPLIGVTVEEAFPDLARLALHHSTGSDRIELADGAVLNVHWSKIETARGDSVYERRKTDRTSTLLVLHDVTPLIQAERAERQARIEHEEASAAKSALMMTMSHELRTPLNAVIGFSDLIRDEAFGAHASPQYTEFAGMAAAGGRQLLGIVEDLLQAAEFQAGRAEPDRRRAAIDDVTGNAVAALSNRSEGFALTPVVSGGDIVADLDTSMIELALRHLLANAEKFAGAEAAVTIDAHIDDGDLVIVVKDDGPGLADGTDTATLMALFQQADGSLTRSGEGCGLGLFLTRSVAEAHGGTLVLDGRDGFEASMRLPGCAAATPADRSVSRAA